MTVKSNIKFQDMLKSVMENHRYTSVLLAKKTGLNPTAISHFLNGRREPSLGNFRKICVALEVAPSILLDI